MEAVLLVATWLFVVTHVDTLIVLVAFCADEDYHVGEVLLGHYLGFSAGLAGAVIATAIAAGFFQTWTFLLGIVPLSMGLWGLVRQYPETDIVEEEVIPGPAGRVSVVTATGIGLSGENLAVFIPFFVGLPTSTLVLVLVLYLIAAGVVFLVAFLFARRSTAVGAPDWVNRWLVPCVLVAVGLYVLVTGWVVV